MNEACLNFIGEDISKERGKAFTIEVLQFMRKKLADYQEQTGHLFNLEATPAEGVAFRLPKEDQLRFPGIIQAGPPNAPYYTNSTHLPVDYTDNPLFALDHQDDLQMLYTGGTVLHLFATVAFGSGIARTWFGTMSFVCSNHQWLICVSTCPLKGIWAMMRSKEECLSVETSRSLSFCR